MLIKSTRDSGICVGVWEGLREAKAQTKTDPVLPSTPGTDEGGGFGLRYGDCGLGITGWGLYAGPNNSLMTLLHRCRRYGSICIM